MKKLIEILNDCCPDINFEEEKALVENGILDSLDVVTIVGELNDYYNIDIGVDDIVPENFNSLEAIYSLIRRLGAED